MKELPIRPEQCRAARALLAWSQDDLSAKAKIAKRTVALFETGQREPYARTLAALRKSLERAGVVFIEENGGGPGVRLRKKGKR
jgi:transcriptional regulator with XRE-family HTH domain